MACPQAARHALILFSPLHIFICFGVEWLGKFFVECWAGGARLQASLDGKEEAASSMLTSWEEDFQIDILNSTNECAFT